MKPLQDFSGILLHRDVVDMRRSIDGLAAIVKNEMERVNDGRYLFVFVGRAKNRVKILYWDRTGYALWYKRLERGRFSWPKGGADTVEMAPEILAFLLDGVDVFVAPHAAVNPPSLNW